MSLANTIKNSGIGSKTIRCDMNKMDFVVKEAEKKTSVNDSIERINDMYGIINKSNINYQKYSKVCVYLYLCICIFVCVFVYLYLCMCICVNIFVYVL